MMLPTNADGFAFAPEETPSVALPATAEEILRRMARAAPQVTYATGFEELDALIDGGFKARQVAVIAAPTGNGKTALVGGIARTIAPSIPVLWVATEIDEEEQAARLAAIALGARPGEILAHRIAPDVAADAVAGLKVYSYELDAIEVEDPIEAIRVRAAVIASAVGQKPAIVVDYLQMLAADDPSRRRVSVSGIANGLRRLARDLDVPVVAVSSVSRAYYGFGKKQNGLDGEENPQAWLAVAKESGDVEYAAAVIAYLDTSTTVDVDGYSAARLIVAKSRRGRCGFVGLRFHGPTGVFTTFDGALDQLGAARRFVEDDNKVLEAVRRMKSRPAVWREIRSRCGVAGQRADEAFARLRDAGTVTIRPVRTQDSSGRKRRKDLVILPEWRDDQLPLNVEDDIDKKATQHSPADAGSAK